MCCRALIAGGGAPETELGLKLAQYAQTITGVDAYCFRLVFIMWYHIQVLFRKFLESAYSLFLKWCDGHVMIGHGLIHWILFLFFVQSCHILLGRQLFDWKEVYISNLKKNSGTAHICMKFFTE